MAIHNHLAVRKLRDDFNVRHDGQNTLKCQLKLLKAFARASYVWLGSQHAWIPTAARLYPETKTLTAALTGARHTSKKPEKGEVEGVHFFFVKKEAMQKMADGGQLVEWSEGPGGSLTGTAATSLYQVCTGTCHVYSLA